MFGVVCWYGYHWVLLGTHIDVLTELVGTIFCFRLWTRLPSYTLQSELGFESRVLIHVLRCSQMFSDVLRCSQMFSDVLRCSQMFSDVPWDSNGSHNFTCCCSNEGRCRPAQRHRGPPWPLARRPSPPDVQRGTAVGIWGDCGNLDRTTRAPLLLAFWQHGCAKWCKLLNFENKKKWIILQYTADICRL